MTKENFSKGAEILDKINELEALKWGVNEAIKSESPISFLCTIFMRYREENNMKNEISNFCASVTKRCDEMISELKEEFERL
jgi:hypothetical protein